TPDAEGNQDKGPVPYDRFKTVNEEKKALEEKLKQQNETFQQQMLLMQNNTQQVTAQPVKQLDPYMQVVTEYGWQDEPYLSTEQQAQVHQELNRRQQVGISQQQFVAGHPDFSEVVGTSGIGGFQASELLKKAAQKDPTLLSQIIDAQGRLLPYGLQTAYRAAKLEEALDAQASTQQNTSAVGGGGAVNRRQQMMSMTKAEFEKYHQSVMAGKNKA
ncbi:MAG: hypothetical protein ACYTEO_18265, partial [Planctomycetota bacterium]